MIVVISGTNRAGCNSLKISEIIARKYAEAETSVKLLNLQDMPKEIYSPDAYAEKPAAFEPFQQMILDAKGIHVVVPEYNGSFPGALKYFIDMLKFPESFEGISVTYTGISAGGTGAIRACEQLQMVFGYRNGFTYPKRTFLSGVHNLIDQEGNLTDDSLDQRLTKQVKGFVCFSEAVYPYSRDELHEK